MMSHQILLNTATLNSQWFSDFLQELKQDISSFRYEVLDLLGNRRPPRRNYSSSSETTKDDGAMASEDDSESGDGSGGGVGVQKSKSVTFTNPVEDDGRPPATLGVSALVRSISGMTQIDRADEGDGWGRKRRRKRTANQRAMG